MFRDEDVSGSQVSMDEPLWGKVVHPNGYLDTKLQEMCWNITGHHFPWAVCESTDVCEILHIMYSLWPQIFEKCS